MKQKLTLLFLFLAAGISMAHTIDFDHFGKENLDNTGNINYLVKNIEKEIAADEFQLTRAISRKKDITAQTVEAIRNQGHDAHFKALIIAKGEVGNLTTALIKKFDGFGNLQTWVKSLDEVADAKLLAKLNDLDAGYFTKLDVDIANSTFKNAIEKDVELLGAWEILNDGSEVLRTNPENLEKLAKFISETGMEKSKLIGSFGNTKNSKKWIQMKISESELDAIYDGFKNSPPAKLDAWTPEHKAQRWANYKVGCINGQNACINFNEWGNIYDGNIDKAIAANNGVDDYFSTLNGNFSREQSFPDISINTSKFTGTFTRRLDIVNEDLVKGIEFKEYSNGKVYRSVDIRKEYTLDAKLLKDQTLDEIEWIFKGCEPSAPLRADLEAAGIKITLLP